MTIEEIEALVSNHGSITAQPLMDLVVTVVLEAVAAEREACAKECDDVCANFYALYKGRPPYTGKENGRGDPIADGASHGAEKCAAAIRARGQA